MISQGEEEWWIYPPSIYMQVYSSHSLRMFPFQYRMCQRYAWKEHSSQVSRLEAFESSPCNQSMADLFLFWDQTEPSRINLIPIKTSKHRCATRQVTVFSFHHWSPIPSCWRPNRSFHVAGFGAHETQPVPRKYREIMFKDWKNNIFKLWRKSGNQLSIYE